jgi:hypothetical protein
LFDSTLEYHITSLWQQYHRNTMPSLVKNYKLLVQTAENIWKELLCVDNNYKRRCVHEFSPIEISRLRLEIHGTNGLNRAQVYDVRVY